MNTKNKIWLGIGAFAVVQMASLSAPQAQDRTCGWERSSQTGRWVYDEDCGRGERYVNRSGNSERGERWNERGERWNERNQRWERGGRWNNGRDPWGERG